MKGERIFNNQIFSASCTLNKLILDKSWIDNITNQNTIDGKLQGDFKGGHFNEIVFTGEGTTPILQALPLSPNGIDPRPSGGTYRIGYSPTRA